MLAYKFVSWEVPDLSTHKNSMQYVLAEKLEQGKAMTRAEKNKLAELAREYGHIRLGGWLFPLSSLPTYYVEQYGHVYKRRAPDKTSIRATTHGRIDRISLRD